MRMSYGASVNVLYVHGQPIKAQPQFVGLDQANLDPLSRSLIGWGEIDIVLTVDGTTANTVTVSVL